MSRKTTDCRLPSLERLFSFFSSHLGPVQPSGHSHTFTVDPQMYLQKNPLLAINYCRRFAKHSLVKLSTSQLDSHVFIIIQQAGQLKIDHQTLTNVTWTSSSSNNNNRIYKAPFLAPKPGLRILNTTKVHSHTPFRVDTNLHERTTGREKKTTENYRLLLVSRFISTEVCQRGDWNTRQLILTVVTTDCSSTCSMARHPLPIDVYRCERTRP